MNKKIIVKGSDELLDVVQQIRNSKQTNIVITFTQESDLLISPVTFDVLQKVCDEENKLLCVQIIHNSAGTINAKQAGVFTTNSPSPIPQEDWNTIKQNARDRKKTTEEKLKNIQNKTSKQETQKNEQSNINFQSSTNNLSNSLEPGVDTDYIKNTTDTTIERLHLEDFDRKQEDESLQPSNLTDTETDTMSNNANNNETDIKMKPKPEKSSFQQQIDQALNKSRQTIQENDPDIVQKGDFILGIGKDVTNPTKETPSSNTSNQTKAKSPGKTDQIRQQVRQSQWMQQRQTQKPKVPTQLPTSQKQPNSLVGKDFRWNSENHNKLIEQTRQHQKSQLSTTQNETIERTSRKHSISSFSSHKSHLNADRNRKQTNSKNNRRIRKKGNNGISNIIGNITQNLKKFFRGMKGKPAGQITTKLLIPVLILFGVISWLAYNLMSIATVEIFISSKPISVTKTFTGDPDSKFDLDAGTIEIKNEEVTKKRAESTEATGTGSRGNYASGVITFKCFSTDSVTLPEGTVISNTDGLKFKTISEVSMECPYWETATVQAVKYGNEYNLQSGTVFSVDGYTSSDLIAENSASFSGGEKEEFTVVSQEDVDKTVETLKKAVYEEAESELTEALATDGWSILTSTIKHELDGDPEPNPPVGSETDIVTINIATKSTAIYFHESELNDAVPKLLQETAQENNLFEGTKEFDDVQDVKSSVNIEKVDGDKVTVKVTASGKIKPKVNKQALKEKLMGMKWSEGIKYLNNLSISTKDCKTTFRPDWFPKFLWHFPDSNNKLIIHITEVVEEVKEGKSEKTSESNN